ncbi:MAG: hypothetical protein ACRDZ3_21225 [Acidimicrobiia bacterium]
MRQIDRTASVQLPDGTTGRIGYRLSELVGMFDGYEGVMIHPKTEREVLISLEQWRGSDPDTTYLEVGFLEW